MTSDARPAKSPARPKGAASSQPPMMQRSLLSFFKTAAPATAPATNATNEHSNGSNGTPSTTTTESDPMRTPVKKNDTASMEDAPLFLDSSPLFSTDESVLKNNGNGNGGTTSSTHKRKTVDFEDGSLIAYQDESRSVKKFAAAVEKLSLGTPVRKLDLFDIATEDADEPLGSRRSSRGVRRIRYQISDDEDDNEEVGKKDPSTPSKPQRKSRIQLDDDDDSEYEAPAVAPEDDFMEIDEALLEESLLEDEDDIPPPAPARSKNNGTQPKPKPTTPSRPMANVFNASGPSPSKPAPRPMLMLKDDRKKERAAKFEETNSGRYKWLLDIKDAEGNPI
ncbi:hypothetical protein BGX23_001263, partial [Mortierella sp. AD031]